MLRRQAHEALVHRVDAEQTAGLPVTDPGVALAADGVDEMLGVMVSGLPAWATFTPDGQRVRLLATDAGREWVMAFGRFHGTSPTTGKEYDEECGELVGGAPWEGEDEDVTATVAGSGVGPGAVALGARRRGRARGRRGPGGRRPAARGDRRVDAVAPCAGAPARSTIPRMGNNAIEIAGLRVVRGGTPVIPSLDLAVPVGQVVGLLGPSGSGKTTLMRAIVGAQIVEGGTVTVLGLPAGSAALRRRIGYVTQSPSVYADLTVTENLRYAAAILGVDAAAIRQALTDVDLLGHAGQSIGTLSGGERSRVSLAIALLGRPDLLVLDEPTVGLDPVLRRDLWELFHRLSRSGVSLLVSSHVMDEAARCDRLILLRGGGVLADGTLADLLDRTGTTDAEAAFLALVDEAAARDAASGSSRMSAALSARRTSGDVP